MLGDETYMAQLLRIKGGRFKLAKREQITVGWDSKTISHRNMYEKNMYKLLGPR